MFYWAGVNILVIYSYYSTINARYRKELWLNSKNKSNYKTIIRSLFNVESNADNKWQTISMLEIGEKYNTYYKFDCQNEVYNIRRFNKLKHTSYEQIIIGNKNNKIWIDNYNGEKTIGFKIDINKLNNKNGKQR